MKLMELCDEVLELQIKEPSWDQLRKNYKIEASLKNNAPILARACKILYEALYCQCHLSKSRCYNCDAKAEVDKLMENSK